MRASAITFSWLLLFGTSFQIAARQPTRAKHAMVVAEEPLAASIGVTVLKSGGNAIDAAVAVAFALAVTFPYAGNLGGGGFMLVRMADGRSSFFDFRECAPEQATRNMYIDAAGNVTRDSLEGWRASGVPGTVRGLEMAHGRFGKKKWPDLIAPASALARNGFEVLYSLATSLSDALVALAKFPESNRVFLNDGKGWEMGSRFSQPDLARTLDRIARSPNDFYEGETAKLIVAAMAANGGLISASDLKNYKAIDRRPLVGTYKGYDVLTAPPPSAGGIGILQMLGMLEASRYETSGLGSASTVHHLSEVMRRFYADRSEYLGDPDFVKVPVRAPRLISPGKKAPSTRSAPHPARR